MTRDCIAYVTTRPPAHGAFRFSYFSREAFRTLNNPKGESDSHLAALYHITYDELK
jgi:hypothetical protein